MKKSLLFLGVLSLTCSLSAELLIIKKVKDKDDKEFFAPLDINDKVDSVALPIIANILLKYQWPMVTASQLTDAEKNELLSPSEPKEIEKFGKEFIEEEFIQKTMRAALQGKGDNYFVVFVPTALYELFCIDLLFKEAGQNKPLERAGKVSEEAGYIDITEILEEGAGPQETRQEVFNMYKNVNNLFFKHKAPENAFFYVNNQFGEFLLKTYPALKDDQDGKEISQAVQNALHDITARLIKEILDTYAKPAQREKIEQGKDETNKNVIKDLVQNLERPQAPLIIVKVAELEYEARSLNKAILLRGSSFEKMQVCFGQAERKKLAAKSKEKLLAGTTITMEAESIEKGYGQNELNPYSIAFGTSLFAGAILDFDACAFNYLLGYRGNKEADKVTGYALFVDKKAYVEHQNQNLFFIPPLSTLAALFQENEFFHPRSKAAIVLKGKTEEIMVRGICGTHIEDPIGILLITRDPLKHAELFSTFLAQNGRIISIEDESSLTDADFKEVIKNQAEAAEFYRNVRKIAPIMRKAAKRRRDSLTFRKAQPKKQPAVENKPQ